MMKEGLLSDNEECYTLLLVLSITHTIMNCINLYCIHFCAYSATKPCSLVLLPPSTPLQTHNNIMYFVVLHVATLVYMYRKWIGCCSLAQCNYVCSNI